MKNQDTFTTINNLTEYIGKSVTEQWQNLIDSFGAILDINGVSRDMQEDWEKHIEVIINISSMKSPNLWKLIEKFISNTLEEFDINGRVRLTSFICINPEESKNKEDDCRADFLYSGHTYTIEFSSPTKLYPRINSKAMGDIQKRMAKLYIETINSSNIKENIRNSIKIDSIINDMEMDDLEL